MPQELSYSLDPPVEPCSQSVHKDSFHVLEFPSKLTVLSCRAPLSSSLASQSSDVLVVWVRKEQQRNKDKLSDFFLNGYLKKDFGPSMTIVVEQAYNIVHALERYRNDADCDMFLKILMGSLPEQAFVDQQLLLRRVQVRFGNIIVNRHSGVAPPRLGARRCASWTRWRSI